jgi:hypothetical protein
MTLEQKYPLNSNCFDLDEHISNIMSEIVNLRRVPNPNSGLINKMESWKTGLEFAFKGKRCRDFIEMTRIQEGGKIQTELASKQESEIIPKKNREQLVYIALGGVVLLTSLYLLIPSKK